MPARPRLASILKATSVAVVAIAAAGCDVSPATPPPISPGTLGSPREVNIVAKDYLFIPSAVELVPGETVLLHILNGGLEPHEAVLGDTAAQAAWESAEAATASQPPGPTAAVSVPPGVGGLRVFVASGSRVDVLWTVPRDAATDPGGWLVGCHIPGHFARGMVVPIRFVGPEGSPLSSGPAIPPSASG